MDNKNSAQQGRADWEAAMRKVYSVLDKNRVIRESEDGGSASRRIKYIVEGYSLKSIMCQRYSGTSGWQDERNIPMWEFLSSPLPFADEKDEAVISAMTENLSRDDYSRKNVLHVILPVLSGTGRVFNTEDNQVCIDVDKPTVSAVYDSGAIVIGSDLQLNAAGRLKRNAVCQNGPVEYTVITADRQQRQILESLLKAREFPLSSAPALKNLLERVSDLFYVKGNLDELIEKENVDGDCKIAVQVSVQSGKTYCIRLQSAPCPDPQFRFIPGIGTETFLCGDKIVHRDLNAEKQRSELLENSFLHKRTQGGVHFVNSIPALLDLLCFVHDHPDEYVLEWHDGARISVGRMAFPDGNGLALSSGENWFEIEGNLKVDEKSISFKNVLKHLKDKAGRNYIQVDDRTYIRLTEKLKRQLESLSLMMSPSGKIPKYYVGQLAKVLNESGGGNTLRISSDPAYQELLDKMQQAYAMIPDIPEDLNAELRDYQKEGFDWMVRLDSWGAGACLADDMGLGKTVQTIAFLLYKVQSGASLVIAPKSVVPNWKSEIARFAPTMTCRILNEAADREACVDNAGPGDVVLATYGMLTSEEKVLSDKKWNVVCLDEAHYIKNRGTKMSKAAMELDCGSRIILTGTPVQNNLSEVWNLFQFINPGILGTYNDFIDKYRNSPDIFRLQAEHKKLIQPFILRRTKDEVLKDLPVKTEFDYLVPLSAEELDGYEKLREDTLEKISSEEDRISAFAGLTNLKLAACSMSLRDPEWKYQPSKIVHLMRILDGIYNEDDRILVFSQFTSFLSEIKTELDAKGMKYFYLDGQTSFSDRQHLTAEFQNGAVPIFLISLKAGGLGLNLTAANYVILTDVWWNPAIENQAMDRAYRIGQNRDVTVIRLVSQNTIEEKIVRLQDSKQKLSDNILDGTSSTSKLTYDEILELLQK